MQGISKKMDTVKILTGTSPRSAVSGLCTLWVFPEARGT